MYKNEELKQCPICKQFTESFEMYCICGYEFGGNRCTNLECKRACGDFTCFCPECGSETQNYYDGYLQGIPTNVK